MIELQGTGEQAPFDRKRLNALLDLGDKGIAELIELQRQALANLPKRDRFILAGFIWENVEV